MNVARQVYGSYLRDLGCLIRELADGAKRAEGSAVEPEGRAYAIGRLMALHEVVSLMQQQALAFQIRFEDICLEGIDPERDLV
jgi:hypothetical protein